MPQGSLLSPSEAFKRLNPVVEKQTEEIQQQEEFKTLFAWQLDSFGLTVPDTVSKEICTLDPLCRLPNTPDWLLGFVNVRSQVIPVFSLEQYLGIEVSKTPKLGLMLGKGAKQFAFALQQYPKKIQLSSSQKISHGPVPEALQVYVTQAYLNEIIWCEWRMDAFMEDLSRALNAN